MCCESEARPGLINRVRAWLSGPAEQPVPGPTRPDWLDDPEALRQAAEINRHHAIARNLAEGLRLCSHCQTLLGLDEEEDPPLHPGWCWTCSQSWLEGRVLAPLVDRLGRRGARRALRRLVSEVKRLV